MKNGSTGILIGVPLGVPLGVLLYLLPRLLGFVVMVAPVSLPAVLVAAGSH